MKKHVLFLVVVAILGIGVQSQAAFWNGTVITPPYGAVNNVENFDWSSSGSGMISRTGWFCCSPCSGHTVYIQYQANLVGYNAPGGAPIPDANLNTNYEFTVVTKLNELVQSVTPLPPVSLYESFKTVGGTWAMYYDDLTAGPGVKSNTAAGTGFNDGLMVANGTWNPNQVSTFTADFNTWSRDRIRNPRGTGSCLQPCFLQPGSAVDLADTDGKVP